MTVVYVCMQEQTSDIFHGFIRVVMNLIRPVQMSLSSQPASDCDVTVTSRDQNEVTTFHLPKNTTKVIHITRCVDNSNNDKNDDDDDDDYDMGQSNGNVPIIRGSVNPRVR